MGEPRVEKTSFAIPDLRQFAAALLEKAGMDAEKSAAMARLLVLTDAMGRRTHGMAMLLLYLKEIQNGGMRTQGEPEVVDEPILQAAVALHRVRGAGDHEVVDVGVGFLAVVPEGDLLTNPARDRQ